MCQISFYGRGQVQLLKLHSKPDGKDPLAQRINITAVDRTYSSPILNPVLYSLISKRFRKKLKSIFCGEISSSQFSSSRTTRFRLSTFYSSSKSGNGKTTDQQNSVISTEYSAASPITNPRGSDFEPVQ